MSASILRNFRRDEKGVSALEFALIAPLLALFYVGCVELSTTLIADRKVTTAASSMGDLVARESSIDNCQIDDVFEAVRLAFQPYSDTQARLRVSSIVPDAGDPNTTLVDWSYSNANWTDRAAGSSVTLPAGIMATDGSIIMAEVEYTYSPPFNQIFQTDPVLDDIFYMRPRASDEVIFSSVTCP